MGVKKNTRVLVTGGVGFLGSHLCERLLADGHDVLCVDNFYTGAKDNIAHLLGNPCFEVMRHDVTFPLYVEVDEIYNLACPASPIHYQHDPVQTTKTSVHGAINMLGLAKRVKAKIFQASTSEVYGDPIMHPQMESYWGNVNPIGTRSCYDEGKRCAETLFFDYYRQHKLRIKVGRIFNTYGPRMHPNDGRVVSNFIVQALKNEPITLYGDGAVLLTATHSLQDPGWSHKKAPIVIGDYAWIARNAIVLQGVTIGRGAVVGAGAVVRMDVPDYVVVLGNPAINSPIQRNSDLRYSPVLWNAPLEAWVGPTPRILP